MPNSDEEVEVIPHENVANIEIVGADDCPILYADAMEVGASFFDFKLNPRVTIRREGDVLRQRQLCSLRISPPHFKRLVEVMNHHLDIYEQQFGAIPTVAPADDEAE